MMNDETNPVIEALASAWTVPTFDLSQRVANAIGASAPVVDGSSELLDEIRAMRREMQSFRQSNALLHEEVLRLRLELNNKKVARLAPYAPTEGLVRLS